MATEQTSWTQVATTLTNECPSLELRNATARLLERIAQLGPLGPDSDEFQRVYRFLEWNEHRRVAKVVDALLAKPKKARPHITRNAWKYVTAVLDEWIVQARVFYLVCGILECTLRARLNARLSDEYGSRWPQVSKAVPPSLRDPADSGLADQAMQVRHIASSLTQPATVEALAQFALAVCAAVSAPVVTESRQGDEYLRDMSLGALRIFVSDEQYHQWDEGAKLGEIFRRDTTASPPVRDEVKATLRRLNNARNAMAHYTPRSDVLNFERPLYDAAALARWLGADLQHIYSSVDIRRSTELSVLLGPLRDQNGWPAAGTTAKCGDINCAEITALDWVMERAPRTKDDAGTIPVTRLCPSHRVSYWRRAHPSEIVL